VSWNCSASRRGLGRAGIAVSRLTTASRAAICTTVAVTTAYEEDLVSDGYVNNSTSVCCWRPDVSASFHTLRAELTPGLTCHPELAVMVPQPLRRVGILKVHLPGAASPNGFSDPDRMPAAA